jgi:hypothetical protein
LAIFAVENLTLTRGNVSIHGKKKTRKWISFKSKGVFIRQEAYYQIIKQG